MKNRSVPTSVPDTEAPAGLRNIVSRRQVLAVAGGAALLAACSSDSKKAADTTVAETAPPTTEEETTTTVEETTTTVEETTTTVEEETATTVEQAPVEPLTGLPLQDEALTSRVALVVKVSNDPKARPQTGLNEADIVFEAWGAGPTRFATVWHSRDLDFVGPIRSCREQDVDLVGSFNRAVFACSGGNGGNIALLRNSDLLLITEGQGPGWELDPKKGRPHKTHANTALLRSNADGSDRTAPTQQFNYRAEGEAPTQGEVMTGFNLQIQQVYVEWRYDYGNNRYIREQDKKPHLQADGTQVTSENVIICFLDYFPSTTDRRSPDGTTTGTNPAVVFTGGHMIAGSWTRGDRLAPFTFTDGDGAPILLTPGRTFIELPNSGKGSFTGGNDRFEGVA